jgi:hypothetical protein
LTSASRERFSAASWLRLGRAGAFGVVGHSSAAVSSDTATVAAFTAPASQEAGTHRFSTETACVVPQATMKAPNRQNIP